MEKLIVEYLSNGGELFKIREISTIRDGGTVAIFAQGKNDPVFYLDKNDYSLHDSYPTTDENRVKDEATKAYVMTRIKDHKEHLEGEIGRIDHIIEMINIAK